MRKVRTLELEPSISQKWYVWPRTHLRESLCSLACWRGVLPAKNKTCVVNDETCAVNVETFVVSGKTNLVNGETCVASVET